MPTQNVIALITDFDHTLAPEYMQTPLFRAYDISQREFWEEKERWIKKVREKGGHLDEELAYLNLLLANTGMTVTHTEGVPLKFRLFLIDKKRVTLRHFVNSLVTLALLLTEKASF